MDHNNDRRVRRTKRSLRMALTKLLAQKDIKDITVKEVTELADVNRGTFYLHYTDIYDLNKQIQDSIIKEFDEILSHFSPEPGVFNNVIAEAFKFIADNSDMCILLTGKNSDSAFLNNLKEIGRVKSLNVWNKMCPSINTELLDYYYAYSSAGFVGLLDKWMSDGMKKTPEEMSVLALKLVTQGSQGMRQAY